MTTTAEIRQTSLLNFADEAAKPKAVPWPDAMPQPGIYAAVPFSDYCRWPAVNAHALIVGATITAKHMKAYIDGKYAGDSKDRKFGRGTHAALLEPDTFRERFPLAKPCCAILSSGQRKGQECGSESKYRGEDGWFCGTHAKALPSAEEPADYLSGEEYERIERVKASVFGHKVVRMLRQFGGCEVSLVWNHEGFPAKARCDKLIIDGSCPDTVIDLKKCRPGKATEDDLQRDIREYGYDVQCAWYVAGIQTLRPEKKPPLYAWVFMEDGQPFDVRPVWASKAMLEVGRMKMERAFKTYAWCASTDTWPGYAEDIEELSPANWELTRYGLG